MTKRINKILWHGTEVPQASSKADGLDGLNEGELFIKNDPEEPGIFIRTTDSKVVKVGDSGIKLLNRLFTAFDANGNQVAFDDFSTTIASIRANYGLWTEYFLSAKGRNPNTGSSSGGDGASTLGGLNNVADGADVGEEGYDVAKMLVLEANSNLWTLRNLSELVGLDEDALAEYLTTNNYAKKSDIPSLDGYATESWVLDKGYATTSDLDARIDALVNGAPAAYDTLKEIADVLGKNVDSIADILDALGTKANKVDVDAAISAVNASISALNTELSGKIDLKLDAATFNELFEKVQLSDGTWAIRAKLGLYTDYFLSAKGANASGGSSTGGAGALYQLADVLADGQQVSGAAKGALLMYNGTQWQGVAQSEIVPNLTGYATESWVLSQGFLTQHQDLSDYAKLTDIPTIPTTDINKGVTAYGWGDHSKVGYLTGITSKLVTDALGFTPFDKDSFTKANIKSTLGISDWALASSKPSYTTTEVTEGDNLYFTNARAVSALKSITDGLQSDIDTKLDASVFSELFEKVTLEGGVTAIRAKYGLFTDYFLSAKGANTNGESSSSGGLITSLYRYADLGKTFADTNNDTFNAYAINAIHNRVSVLEGKATNVSFTQSLTSGTQIGTITIDGASKNIYAPTIPTKLSQFTDDVVSGKYLHLSGGTIRNSVDVPLVINNSTDGGASCINFRVANVDKAQIGYENVLQGAILYNYNSGKFIGVKDDGTPVYSGNTLWHSGNFTPSDYLPLSGGTISGTTTRPLTIKTSISYIETHFIADNNVRIYLGWNIKDGVFLQEGSSSKYIGIKTDGTPYYYNGTRNTIIHSGNYTDYTYSKSTIDTKLGGYLPLSGGTLTGTSAYILSIKRTSNNPSIAYYANDTLVGFLGINTSGEPLFVNNSGESYPLIHSGNIGSQSVASAAKLTTARTIWGQSFDGTKNIEYSAIPTMQYINFRSYVDETNVITLGRSSSANNDLYLITRYSNNIRFETYNAERMRIAADGNVGIGTTSPQCKLDVVGDVRFSSEAGQNSYLYLNRNGSDGGILFQENGKLKWQIVNINNGLNFYDYTRGVSALTIGIDGVLNYVGTIHSTIGIYSDGYVSAKGQNTSSDMRLKNVLNDVVLNVSDIANAPSIRFAWKNGGGVDVGSSAQYWQGLLPDAVKERDGMLEMQYANIALLSAIAIAKRMETHEERIERLEREVKELRIENVELKNKIGGIYGE